MTQSNDEEGPISHPCTLHGCVQILEIISLVVALACSFLNSNWLTEAGGGYVSFALICCTIFSAAFFIIHQALDITGLVKVQMTEWIGYICGFFLLFIALVVSVRGSTLLYTETLDDGRQGVVETSPIVVTAVFGAFAVLFYLIHSIQLSLLRFRHSRAQSKQDSKTASKKQGKQPL